MVSLDARDRSANFAQALAAKHVLLSDPSGETAAAYGVGGLGGLFAKRWTFYIDEDAVIRAIDKDVKMESAGRTLCASSARSATPAVDGVDDGSSNLGFSEA